MAKPKASRRELKQLAVEYKGGRCEECGYDKCLAAMTFHHRKEHEKEFGISNLINAVSWRVLKRELDKCALLCNRCHVEAHHFIAKSIEAA